MFRGTKTKIWALAALTTLATAGQASAKPDFNSGDWSLFVANPTDASSGVCMTLTTGRLNGKLFHFNLLMDKSGARPLEVILKPGTGQEYKGLKGFTVKGEGNQVFKFAKLGSAAGAQLYWNLPTDTDGLLALLRKASALKATAAGVKGDIALSLSGSTAVLNELTKRCGQGSNVIKSSAEIEKLFVPQAALAALDLTKLTTDQADSVRALVVKAIAAYRGIDAVKARLAKLEAHYGDIAAHRDAVAADVNKLTNQTLPNAIATRDSAISAIATATANVADLQAQIVTTQQQLDAANLESDTALTNLKPFIAQHNQLKNAMENDQDRLSNAQSRVASIDSSINDAQNQIDQLTSELSSLQNDLANLQNAQQDARARSSQADWNLQNFNPQWEVQSRMQNDWQLNNIQQQLGGLQKNVKQLSQRVNFARVARDGAAALYQQCMASAGNTNIGNIVGFSLSANHFNGGGPNHGQGDDQCTDEEMAANPDECQQGHGHHHHGDGHGGPGDGQGGPGDGQGGWNGPGGNGGPGDGGGVIGGGFGPAPAEPTPEPQQPAPQPEPQPQPGPIVEPPPVTPGPVAPVPVVPDCSGQKSAFEMADNELRNAKHDLDNAQWQLQSAQDQRDQRINEINQDVTNERNNLIAEAQDARDRVIDLDSQAEQVRNRMAQIAQVDRPSAQSQLAHMQSLRPAAVSEVQSAKKALASSTNAYVAYNKSVNYDTLEGIYNMAQSKVSGITSTLASQNSKLSKNQKAIVDQTALRDSMIAKIASTTDLIAKQQAALADLNSQLVPYDSEKADVMKEIDAATDALRSLSKDYAAAIKTS